MEAFHALQPVLILLFVGVLAIVFSRPLRVSPIVGFLLAGMLIGPHGLGVIEESGTTHLLSELGVVFLLFDIGLHFSLPHIWDARRDILGLGPAQVALSTLVFGGIALLTGFDLAIAIIIGATLALSSTAVAVKTMTDSHQQHSPVGTSSTAVLIFQDICAIFLLILASTLGDTDSSLGAAMGFAALKAGLALLAAIFVGRYLIGPMFKVIAKFKDEELFTATALLLVLATAGATGLLGLSLTLGAFLAGMIISETPYRHLIQTETKPFRGLLLGFFFITVGMMLDIQIILDKWWMIALTALALLSMKTLFIYLAARLMRSAPQSALQMAVLLAQGSEFAFVIFAMPSMHSVMGEAVSAVLITAVAASMALTPLMVSMGHKVANKLADKDWEASKKQRVPMSEAHLPVIIIGMGEIGQRVADGLAAHGISYRGIESDHDQFVYANTEGYQVAFGDATDLRLLETIKMAHTDTLVITFADYEIAQRMAPIVAQRYPGLKQLIAVNSEVDRVRFSQLGMQAISQQSFPHGLDLATAVLETQSIDSEHIEKWMHRQQEVELETAPAHTLEVN